MEQNDLGELEAKLDRLNNELVVLRQAFEVHTTAETGYRALQLEKIENLRLSMQHSALLSSSDFCQRYDARLAALEHTITAHISQYNQEAQRAEHMRRDRANSFLNLKNGLWILGLTQAAQLILMWIGYAWLKQN